MRVLHIWNTAGVASLMCRSLRSVGIKSDLLMRSSHDTFGFGSFYCFDPLDLNANEFNKKAVQTAKDYDIIHVHSAFKLIDQLRELYPKKRIIFQAHGSEITNNDFNDLESYLIKYDHVISSTIDLKNILDSKGVDNTLVLNAVDTCLFKKSDAVKNRKALLIEIDCLDMNATRNISFVFLKQLGLDDVEIEIFNRNEFIPFYRMPELLSKYEYLIDVKVGKWMNGKPTQAKSKTALESLACGLKVVNFDGSISEGLDDIYTPEQQLNQIINVYEKK